ncbi:glycoside hydrolase family 9 protein, partial [Paenibacillus sepulcri]|nr:glycoside hydrolase family 9 protein [Paenibacillus sepulcri]
RVFFSATEGPLKAETLYAAGALAMAYNTPLLHEYYPAAKLEGYKQAALKAFGAFENHANDNAFWNSNLGYDVYTAGIHTWSDEMLFAASNLHKITGESKYLAWINSELPANLGAEQKRWSWDNQGPWLVAFLGLYNDSNLSGAVRQNAYNAILEWADTIMSANNQAPYGVPMVDSTYTSVGWYFSGSQIAFPMSVAYGVSRLQKYKNQIATTWNYLLGSNPLSESFISGMGDPEHRPRWLVHEISQYNYAQYSLGNGGWSEMIPGIPNSDLQQGNFPAYFANDPWNNARREKWFPALGSYPALYRYSDSWNVQNEFVIANVAHNAASIIPLIAVDGGDPGDTTPPAVPTGLTADAGDSQITLSWNASSESDLEGYNVYVNGVKKNTSPLTATGYTAAGLANGTTYALTITAVDQSGNESAHSAAVQAAPEADIGST